MTDKYTQAAKLIRGLQDRVTELEQTRDATWEVPNIIRSVTEALGVTETTPTVTEEPKTQTTWGQDAWEAKNWE